MLSRRGSISHVRVAVSVLFAIGIAFIAGGCGSEHNEEAARRTTAGPTSDAPGSSVEAKGKRPGYPTEWATTLAEAKRRLRFPLLLPNHARANRDNITDVFVRPGNSAVMVVFPPPESNAAHVRQEYVELYISPWTSGNADERLEQYVLVNPVDGRSTRRIDGKTFLVQEPNSADDVDSVNPAFIRFVRDGLDVQLSGGDDVELLLQIADTLRF